MLVNTENYKSKFNWEKLSEIQTAINIHSLFFLKEKIK